jgi:hypothetical protein
VMRLRRNLPQRPTEQPYFDGQAGVGLILVGGLVLGWTDEKRAGDIDAAEFA